MPRWVVYIFGVFIAVVAVNVGYVFLSMDRAPQLVPVADEWQGLKR